MILKSQHGKKEQKVTSTSSLSVPESMEKIYPVAVKQSSPVFPGAVQKEWFHSVDDGKDSVSTAQATDMAFNISFSGSSA